MTIATPSVAARLDALPLTRLHLVVLVISGFGLAIDVYEIGLGSAFGAIFSGAPYSASAQSLSWLLSSVYIGAVLGASIGGWLAYRVGRRIVLTGMLWLLAATAALAGASVSIEWLTASRTVMGLTLGAFPPLLTAYLSDLLPARSRGKLIFVTMAVAFIGAPVGVFFIRTMTPLEFLGLPGWRWSLLVGALGAVISALAFRRLPESPRWLSAVGREQEAEIALQRFERSRPASWADSSKTPPSPAPGPNEAADSAESPRLRFAKYAGLCFLSPWSTAAFPLLIGAMLVQKGFKLSDTLFYVGLSAFGPIIGTLLAAFAVDRFDRRLTLAVCATVMLISGIGFEITNAPGWLLAATTSFFFCSAVYLPMLNIYGAELFNTRLRASAVTGAWAFNRLGAAAAPLLLVPILSSGGTLPVMALICGSLIAGILLVAVSAPGRSRLSVT
ncbi:MFS transporter [Variovorax sp. CCNWLW235]|uniref:MFS transporter n=1 Tax=Variovorax sp. CCNWLW235 TaxID=3127463 RepID=UPI0030777E6A